MEEAPTESGQHLDRDSFIPLYFQLQEVLKERIETGVWLPGEKLLSEPDLGRLFGVSRIVVRRALEMLENDRQVVRVHGSGTYVARPKLSFGAVSLSRMRVDPLTSEGRLATRILNRTVVSPEQSVRDALELAPAAQALRLTVLVKVDELPVGVGISYLPPGSLSWTSAREGDGALDGHASESRAHDLTPCVHNVEACQCTLFDAQWLEISNDSPVFFVSSTERSGLNGAPVPVEFARYAFRSDSLQLELANPARQAGTA